MTENELSYIIIGAALEVHRNLGAGLMENAYEQALVYELKKSKSKSSTAGVSPSYLQRIEH